MEKPQLSFRGGGGRGGGSSGGHYCMYTMLWWNPSSSLRYFTGKSRVLLWGPWTSAHTSRLPNDRASVGGENRQKELKCENAFKTSRCYYFTPHTLFGDSTPFSLFFSPDFSFPLHLLLLFKISNEQRLSRKCFDLVDLSGSTSCLVSGLLLLLYPLSLSLSLSLSHLTRYQRPSRQQDFPCDGNGPRSFFLYCSSREVSERPPSSSCCWITQKSQGRIQCDAK